MHRIKRLLPGCLTLLAFLSQATAADRAEQQTACRAERWSEAIQKFRDMDSANPALPGGTVFVGSSSIRLWDLEKWFPDRQFLNRGFGGSEICDSVHYFETLVALHQPEVVVLYAGDNDVAGGKKAKQVLADFQAFDAKMKEQLPAARLVFISIKPSLARWDLAGEMRCANCLIANHCRQDSERLTYLDVWCPMLDQQCRPREELFVKDGLHLNDEGYQLWTALLKRQLGGLEK